MSEGIDQEIAAKKSIKNNVAILSLSSLIENITNFFSD